MGYGIWNMEYGMRTGSEDYGLLILTSMQIAYSIQHQLLALTTDDSGTTESRLILLLYYYLILWVMNNQSNILPYSRHLGNQTTKPNGKSKPIRAYPPN